MGWLDTAVGVLSGGLSTLGEAATNNGPIKDPGSGKGVNSTLKIDQTNGAPGGGPGDPPAKDDYTPPPNQDDENRAWLKAALDRIQQFANQMMTYDPNDPLAQSLTRSAALNAQQGATNAGLGDRGISAAEQGRAVSDAATRYEGQRQQMGLDAYSRLASGALAATGQANQQSQFDKTFGLAATQYNDQLNQRAWDAQNQANVNMWGALGGAFGGPAGQSFGSAGANWVNQTGNSYRPNNYLGTGNMPSGSPNPAYGGYDPRYGSSGYSGPYGGYGLGG